MYRDTLVPDSPSRLDRVFRCFIKMFVPWYLGVVELKMFIVFSGTMLLSYVTEFVNVPGISPLITSG
jgi:hypothetical protein